MQNITKNMQNNMQNMQKICQKICKPVLNMQNTDMSIFCIFCIYIHSHFADELEICRPKCASGIVTCSMYSVQPGTYHLVPIYSIIPPCTAPFEYVLFTPSTYSVRTFYPKYVLSTYFSNQYVLGTY